MQTAWRVWVRYVIPVKTGPSKRFSTVLAKTLTLNGYMM
jgi:hypothetical protein